LKRGISGIMSIPVHSTVAADVSPSNGDVIPEPPPLFRAQVTNKATKRFNKNTALGRRLNDLYRALLNAIGNPTSTLAHAHCLRAAELRVLAEDARAKLLAGDGDPDTVVRLEGAADRAERKLGLDQRKREQARGPTLAEHLVARATGRSCRSG
jgi:hypothetical protein